MAVERNDPSWRIQKASEDGFCRTEFLSLLHGGVPGCFIITVFTIKSKQGSLSVSLPAILYLLSSSSSALLRLPSPCSYFPPLVPPLGCSTDAGWRHSGLILLLLMLMLKEAIGTCYFCCHPVSLGLAKGY